jgi:hypothetical protein
MEPPPHNSKLPRVIFSSFYRKNFSFFYKFVYLVRNCNTPLKKCPNIQIPKQYPKEKTIIIIKSRSFFRPKFQEFLRHDWEFRNWCEHFPGIVNQNCSSPVLNNLFYLLHFLVQFSKSNHIIIDCLRFPLRHKSSSFIKPLSIF